MNGTSPWADRATQLYDGSYARRYREHDDEFESSGPCRAFAEWLGGVCAACTPPIDVLDLGCGTGRYFWALTGVRDLVGVDASAAMLDEARHPYNADRIGATSVSLVQADVLTGDFEPARFDLVYSIGVLAEHVPLEETLVAHVARWLRPGGRFAFTTVHPASFSVPRTVPRRLGEWVVPFTGGAIRRRLRERLLSGGLYADEERVLQLLTPSFIIDSLTTVVSEAHLHCACVARKAGGRS